MEVAPAALRVVIHPLLGEDSSLTEMISTRPARIRTKMSLWPPSPHPEPLSLLGIATVLHTDRRVALSH